MPRTVARALEILDLLAQTGKPMTQIEICQALKLPKSSAHDLMQTLLEREFIVYDNEQFKTFKLGLHVFEIGMTVIENRNMVAVARPYLVQLHDTLHETVFLAVENRNNIVYVDCAEERGIMGGYINLGARRPMYCSGLGKAILAAYNDEEKVKRIINSGTAMAARTPNTITTIPALLRELALTRQRGFAIDNREVEPDTFCLAAPIYNRSSEVISAISIASVFTRMQNPAKIKQCGELINQTALEISRQMGFRGSKLF